MGAPNSPQWFNTGLNYSYGITGNAQGHHYVDPKTKQLTRSKDAYSRPQPHACFILSIKDDLVNLDGLVHYYDFLGNHNIRTIVFNPENAQSFFEGAVVAILEQRYREFFRSKFNVEMNEIIRLDLLE